MQSYNQTRLFDFEASSLIFALVTKFGFLKFIIKNWGEVLGIFLNKKSVIFIFKKIVK